jgi:hypothetical protein
VVCVCVWGGGGCPTLPGGFRVFRGLGREKGGGRGESREGVLGGPREVVILDRVLCRGGGVGLCRVVSKKKMEGVKFVDGSVDVAKDGSVDGASGGSGSACPGGSVGGAVTADGGPACGSVDGASGGSVRGAGGLGSRRSGPVVSRGRGVIQVVRWVRLVCWAPRTGRFVHTCGVRRWASLESGAERRSGITWTSFTGSGCC